MTLFGLDEAYEHDRDALTEREWRELFAGLRANVEMNLAIIVKRNELAASGRNYFPRRSYVSR